MALSGLVLLDLFLAYVLVRTIQQFSRARQAGQPLAADLVLRLVILATLDVGVVLMIVGLALHLSR
jgi:hypothetical protein